MPFLPFYSFIPENFCNFAFGEHSGKSLVNIVFEHYEFTTFIANHQISNKLNIVLYRTHVNYSGLLESLRLHNVKDQTEIKAILRLSDYGRKGTEIWKILAKTNWNRIEAPGKYILKILRTSQ